MFWDGDTSLKATCPAGAGHMAQDFVFVLPTTAAEIVIFDDD